MLRSLLVIIAASMLLTGCGSKEPMDHLPECTSYVSVNMKQLREQAGAKRAIDVMGKLSDEAPPSVGKMERLYVGISGSMRQPSAYGVMQGTSGMSDELVAELNKQGGVTESKINGCKAYTKNDVTFVVLSDAGAIFARQADIDTMFKVAKKKSPGASGSATFGKLSDLASSPVRGVFNVESLISQMGDKLAMMGQLNPKGADAVKEVRLVTLKFDWDAQPKLEVGALIDSSKAADLAGFVNAMLAMGKAAMASNKAPVPGAELIQQLEAKADGDAVKIALDVPKDMADGALEKLEGVVATLPKDKDQRKQAIQQAMMGMMSGAAK